MYDDIEQKIVCIVSDNGKGMSQTTLDRLFKLDNLEPDNDKIGLGLFVSRSIIHEN